MNAAILILGVLTTLAFAIGGFLKEDGRHIIAEDYFLAGYALSGLTILLIIIHGFLTWRRWRRWRRALKLRRASKNPEPKSVALPSNPQLRQAIIRLQSFSEHLPTDDLSETYINDYHALLDTAGAELQQDLTPFHIPQSELRRHVVDLDWQGGWRVKESKELFCPPHVFRIALSGALKFIETCPPPQTEEQIGSAEKPKELETKPKTPEPQPPQPKTTGQPELGDYQPDEMERRILAHLFKDNVDRTLGSIIKALNFASAEEAKFHLERLIEHHHVDRPHPSGTTLRIPGYQLRQKGREFVIQNNLHREEAKLATPEPQPPQPHTADDAKPADFKPDELCVKIMKLIYRTPSLTLLVEIVEALKVDIILIAPRLDKLLTYKYVTRVNEHPMSPLERSPFILTPKGVKYLEETPHYKAPHPSGDDILDDEKKAIIHAFTHPDCYPSEAWLSTLLRMHRVRLKVHLTDLIEHGYLTGNSFDEYDDQLYDLTDKANRYIVWQGWVD